MRDAFCIPLICEQRKLSIAPRKNKLDTSCCIYNNEFINRLGLIHDYT